MTDSEQNAEQPELLSPEELSRQQQQLELQQQQLAQQKQLELQQQQLAQQQQQIEQQRVMKQALDAAVRKYSKKGWRLEHQTDTTAQVIKERRFTCMTAILTLLTGGLWLLAWLTIKNPIVLIEVSPNGKVRETKGKGA